MSGLVDTWMTPQEQCGGMLCLFSCFITSVEGLTIDFNCIGFGCNALYPWDSRSVLWTQTVQPSLHRHSGEKIMSEFKLFGELSLKVLQVQVLFGSMYEFCKVESSFPRIWNSSPLLSSPLLSSPLLSSPLLSSPLLSSPLLSSPLLSNLWSLHTGISRPAGRDESFYPAAGGGPVGCPSS